MAWPTTDDLLLGGVLLLVAAYGVWQLVEWVRLRLAIRRRLQHGERAMGRGFEVRSNADQVRPDEHRGDDRRDDQRGERPGEQDVAHRRD